MDISSQLGKVPKWGWYAGAGIAAGGIILTVKKRTGDPVNRDDTGMTQTPDVQGTPTTAPSGAGLVVPQVTVVPNDTTDQGMIAQGLAGLQELYMSGTTGLLNTFQGILDPVLGQNLSITQSLLDNQQSMSQGLFGLTSQAFQSQADIAASMAAGPPPAPAAQQPIVVYAPVPTPVPQSAAPAPVPDRCVGSYPNLNETNGRCYKVGCSSGRRVHIYSNGEKVVVSGNCP